MKTQTKERSDFYYTIDEIEVGDLLCHDVETVTEYAMDRESIDLDETQVLAALVFVDDDSFEQHREATKEECKLIAKEINGNVKWSDMFATNIQ